MMIRRLVTALSIAVAMGGACTLSACGAPPPKAAKVEVGSLPAGATFKGVWFNPVFGHLHVIPNNNNEISGKWEAEAKGKWGRMTGAITGDVIRFEWEEFNKGGVGLNNRKGKGYFKYVPAPADTKDPPHLKGEWGFNDKDTGGGTWDCVMELNIEPNFSRVGGGDEPAEGSWDQGGKKLRDDHRSSPWSEPPRAPDLRAWGAWSQWCFSTRARCARR